MSVQAVACFDLSDGDRVFLFWNIEERKFQIMSSLDPTYEDCTLRDVRRTIYWALGQEPTTCELPLTVRNLVRRHSEILENGEPWSESCTQEQCVDFLSHDWDGYAANKIFLKFEVV